ncbi:MAG: hypothetical protein ACYTG5_02780 [Planctomycetota bacterium]|jgi:hypothetical protein
MKPIHTLLALTLIAVVTGSCKDNTPKKEPFSLEPAAGDSEPMKFAKEHYKVFCSTCHGFTGEGDGIVGAKLTPRPRSFALRSWQEQTTDDRIRKVILEGGAAVGLNPLMAANAEPRVEDEPEVLEALVTIVRGMGR